MAHIPVLLKEAIEVLKPEPGRFFIDGTIDGGGHAEEILKRISPKGRLLGIDLDDSMIESLKRSGRLEKYSKENEIEIFCGNYANLPEILKEKNLPKGDGLLLDLGFSSEQLESSGRGFTFKKDEPLIMTYDPSATPVREILRNIEERELADIIYQFGGERFSRKIAAAIKRAGRKKKIETTGELNEIIKSELPKNYERGRIEPSTRTFQALRIYANRELENLENIIKRISEAVKLEGRVAIISFHSLEDRIVKKFFKRMARQNEIEILTPKPIRPTKEESSRNPRSRSAMLRAARVISN
ncbi:MAG: 16S rRNA (cytosine(1402)-N(4))-methyltransferase RsmH [Candidatus Liptonbacteria bacterium]|nr:16S rRNA (cytosine(1402)-N(4))-methyltransferase RsmH [Candidatus Liptonbacteria bacterium]